METPLYKNCDDETCWSSGTTQELWKYKKKAKTIAKNYFYHCFNLKLFFGRFPNYLHIAVDINWKILRDTSLTLVLKCSSRKQIALICFQPLRIVLPRFAYQHFSEKFCIRLIYFLFCLHYFISTSMFRWFLNLLNCIYWMDRIHLYT